MNIALPWASAGPEDMGVGATPAAVRPPGWAAGTCVVRCQTRPLGSAGAQKEAGLAL